MRMTKISVPCCEKCGDRPSIQFSEDPMDQRWTITMVDLRQCQHCGQLVCFPCLVDRACCSDVGRRCKCGRTTDLKDVNIRMDGSSAYKPDTYVMCRECRAVNAGRFRYAK